MNEFWTAFWAEFWGAIASTLFLALVTGLATYFNRKKISRGLMKLVKYIREKEI